MQEINKALCKELRIEMDKALETVGKKFDLEIKTKNMSYNSTSLNVKVECLRAGAEPRTVTDYKRHMGLYRLPELGQHILINGTELKIVGYKSKARKNKIMIQDVNGKGFLTDIETTKRCLIK
jgi:hypothetical protein